MQIYKTLPTNNEFFKRYGKYAPFIAWGVVLAQLLSGFTESGLIYSNIKDATIVFGESTAIAAGVIGAIIGVALIEIIGLRVALTGTVDAFLYKRWTGLDRLFSIGLIVLCCVLIPASFILSLQGGGQIVEQLKERTEQDQKKDIEDAQVKTLAELKAEFEKNKLAVINTYTDLIESINQKAEAEKTVTEQNYQFWKSKGERYKSRINSALIKMQQVEATQQSEIASLKQRQADELKALQQRYQSQQDKINHEATGLIAKATGKIGSKSAAFKTGTKWIVIVAMFFSVFGIILQRIYLKGSGIEELTEANNFYFAPSLFSEKMKLLQDKIQIAKRNRIAERRNQLPQLTPYASSMPIHYLGALERTILQLKMNEGKKEKVIYLDKKQTPINPNDLEKQIHDYTEAQIQLEAENNHTAAKTMEVQAKQVIRLYLERNNQSTNKDAIDGFQNKVIEHINEPNKYENPFNEYRTQIGFKQQNSTTQNGTQHSPLYGDRMEQKKDGKNCAHCGNDFQAKHWNAKYCNDTCRIAAWENRTGRQMKKKCKK